MKKIQHHRHQVRHILALLHAIETLYLLTFFFVLYLYTLPYWQGHVLIESWVKISYFILPILLLKNVTVAVLNRGILNQRDRAWLLMRCVLYVLLTILSYPLIK